MEKTARTGPDAWHGNLAQGQLPSRFNRDISTHLAPTGLDLWSICWTRKTLNDMGPYQGLMPMLSVSKKLRGSVIR